MDAASLNLSGKFWVPHLPHLKEASWVAIGQLAVAAGGLVAIKVCTNVLGRAEFGRFSAALAIAGLGQVCFFGPISQAAMRFLSMATERRILGAYRSSLLKLYLIGGLAVVLCWLAAVLGGFNHMLPVPVALIALYTLASGLQMILLAEINAARLRQWVAGLQVADALFRPALILAVAMLTDHSASQVILSYIVTTLIIVSVLFGLSAGLRSRELHLSPSPDVKRGHSLYTQMASFTWLFVLFGVLGAVGSHGERLLLVNFVSWEDVGAYALMSQLAMAPNLMLTSVINQYYLPMVYQSDPSGASRLGRSYQYYLLFSIVGIFAVAVSVAVLGRWIIPLFSSTAFLGHEHLLWFLALSAGIFNLGQQLVLPGMRENRLSLYVPAKLLHSLGLLCLAFLLTPTWGITGMAVASVVSATVYTLSVIGTNAYLARSASVPA